MSSNLNSLLKERIRDAVAAIYDERGSAAENRYTTPEQLSKALLDALFPEEHDHNTEVTGVVNVPTVADSDDGSTESKKERKKRAPYTPERKAEMLAKRAATLADNKAKAKAAAEAAAGAPAPAPAAEAEAPKPEAKKERKTRTPEEKAATAAKKAATLAAKKAAAE